MKKIIILIFIIVVIGLTFVIYKNFFANNTDSIKIGAPLILSGDFAMYGESSKNGIEIALAEYNSRPEVAKGKAPKVEIIYDDTRGNPQGAVSAYQKLVSLNNVDVIVGPVLVVEAGAIVPLVKKDKIPVFGIVPIPVDQRGNTSNPLGIWPDPTLEAERMAQYVYDQGARSIGALSTKDPWEAEVTKAFATKFKSLGGTVVANEVVLPNSKDTSLPVAKIIVAKPDAVFLGTFYKFTYFVKKLKEFGFEGKLYSIEIDAGLAEKTKPYSDDLQFISPSFYTTEFTKTYKDKYGESPTIPSGQAHDAMSLLLKLVQKINTTNSGEFKQKMLNEMSKVSEFNGVSGKIVFTPQHHTVFPLSIFQINDGIIKKIK